MLLLTATTATSQKVKYKDGQVFVDKEHKFDFTATEDDSDKTKLTSYVLTDVQGQVIFSLTDSTLVFEQNPNETKQRSAYHAYLCDAPSINRKALMPFNPVMGYDKQRIKDLEKAGFFAGQEMTDEIFDATLERQNAEYIEVIIGGINETNVNRTKNYELSEKAFGPLLEREPGTINVVQVAGNKNKYVIKDGDTEVGSFIVTDPDSYKPGALVRNHKEEHIGQVTLYREPAAQAGSTRTFRYSLHPFIWGRNALEENFKWFDERVSSTSSPKSTRARLERVAKYMAEEGIL